ncbi:MAG: MlaD family protein [Alphaproteobacteria bacterium]|nr:MlaD family protein [Alphaproteobacteria bacterium]
MHDRRRAHIITIAALVIGLAAVIFSRSATNPSHIVLTATVKNAEGLRHGSLVRMSGIEVGAVSDIRLRPDFSVDIDLRVANRWKIPDDSAAAIYSANLLGTRYVEILPGASDHFMTDGSHFDFATGSVNIPDMIIMGIERFAGQ